RPLGSMGDGSEGFIVRTIKSTALLPRRARVFTCRGVVFAASSLGTMELLFQMKERGALPRLSGQIGKHVRTNSESLIGVRVPRTKEDLSQGIAIGSRVYIDEHTHIEPVRYPSGSDAMSFLTTILTDGKPGLRRVALWLRNVIGSCFRHPLTTLRVLQPFGWARESVILLCMQALDASLEMRWERTWFPPFGKVLVSRGKKIPTYIAQANE